MSYIFDTFTNFLSGLGVVGRDKMTASVYVTPIWTREQLEASYRSDWIARKAITIPAFDATREWRGWQAEQDQIEKIEEIENKLQVQQKLQQALVRARLYGGSCIMIGVDGNQEEELKPETIKKDGLKFVHVFSPHQLTIENLIRDIQSPWYGQPEHYVIADPQATTPQGQTLLVSSKQQVKIHPSRMVRLIGNEAPDPMLTWGWGDPLLATIHDAVNAAGTVMGSIAVLISEAKFDVIKIPGLTEIFSTDKGSAKLTKRFSEANVAKSVINAVVLDAEEDWQRIGTTFHGMPEVLQMYLQIAAGAVDIPATRFIGMSPSGLNATGDSDMRNYYDRISAEQNLRLKPALEKLDKAIIQSALGSMADEIFYEWNPLWQMDDTQKASIALQKAQATALDVNGGLIPFEALVKGKVNQLIEDGTYPGLDSAIEEAIANADMQTEEQLRMQQEQQAQMMPGQDPNDPGNDNTPPGKGGKGGGGAPPPRMLPPPKPAPEQMLKRTSKDSYEEAILVFGGLYTRRELADRGFVFTDAQWEEAKHSRGQPANAGQFGPGGYSGGSEEGSAPSGSKKKTGATATATTAPSKAGATTTSPTSPSSPGSKSTTTGYDPQVLAATFVSPNVKSGMQLKGAQVELESRQQATLRKASADINEQVGLTKAQDASIIGAWVDGAENSIMTVANDATWDQLVLAGAMKGHLANQKQVAVFKQEEGGKSVLAQFEAKGNLNTIHNQLLRAGLSFHSLVPTSEGARVYILDTEGTSLDAIKKGAARYGKDNPVHFQRGHGAFIGDEPPENDKRSDAEQRASGRTVYEGIINQSPIPGAKNVWQGIHNRWSSPTTEPGYGLTSNAILTETGEAVKPNSVLATDAAKQLNARAESHLMRDQGVDHIDEDNHTPQTDKYLAHVIAMDLKYELASGQSGEHWYNDTVKQAMGIAEKIYPGLSKDTNKKFAYTLALAITSQGETVDRNVALADQAYEHFLKNGSFPEDLATKKPGPAKNFAKVNAMIKQYGLPGAREFFSKEMTAGELTKQTKYDVPSTLKTDTVYGSAVLGPKIGQGFFQNLNGNFQPITMDMWFMRAWGRITNTGIAKGEKLKVLMDKQVARVNNALEAAGLPKPKDDAATIKIADEIYSKHEKDFAAHQKKNKEEGTKKKYDKSELAHASERLMLSANGAMVEQPLGGKFRKWSTDVFKQALDELAGEGIKLDPAAAQAVWWWPEKLLWERQGVRAKDQDTDYASALTKLAAKKGIKDMRPPFANWLDDPDEPDSETDMDDFEEALFKSRHLYRDDFPPFDPNKHPHGQKGWFTTTGGSGEAAKAPAAPHEKTALEVLSAAKHPTGGGSTDYGFNAGDVPKYKALRREWTKINTEMLDNGHVSNPNTPEAKALVDKQEVIVKQIAKLHVDRGTPADISKPGGPRDVVIVGAGPGGLAASIFGGYEGLDTLVVEKNVVAGGQAKYSTRIENFPGFPIGVEGSTLMQSAATQASRLGAEFKLGTSVTGMSHDDKTGLKTITLSDGSQVVSRTVILAGGVEFRKPEMEGADGKGVVVADPKELTEACRGKDAVVYGGANSASQAALGIASVAKHVTLISRSPLEKAMSASQIEAVHDNPNITVVVGDEITKIHRDNDGKVTGCETTSKDGTKKNVDCKAVGFFIGAVSETDWLADVVDRTKSGKIITGKGDPNDETASIYETKVKGVYAVGDMIANGIGRVGVAVGDGQHALADAHKYLDDLKTVYLNKQKLQATHPAHDSAAREEFDADEMITRFFTLDRAHPFFFQSIEDEPPPP